MRGISIFGKQSYREIRPMRGRLMRGLPVPSSQLNLPHWKFKSVYQKELTPSVYKS